MVSLPLLAAGILGLLLIPLHRIILPLWPGPVEEVMILDSAQNAVRLQPARRFGDGAADRSGGISSRPRYAVRIERVDDETLYGYVLGFRDPDQGMLIEQPFDPGWNWLEADQLPAGAQVVVEDPGGARTYVGTHAVARLVRPNRLAPEDKIRLTWIRLKHQWRQRVERRAEPRPVALPAMG